MRRPDLTRVTHPLLRRGLAAVGLIAVLRLFSAGEANQSVTLAARTNRPANNTYIFGESVAVEVCASGGRTGNGEKVQIDVRDYKSRVISRFERAFTLTKVENCQLYEMPADQLGYYRVDIQLSGGARLPAMGSRPPGYLTYAVVPDPAGRKRYPEGRTFFGMQGSFNKANDVLSQLGIRWVLGGYDWRRTGRALGHQGEPKTRGVGGIPDFRWPLVEGTEKPWHVYTLPTLFLIDPVSQKRFVQPGTVAKHSGALNPSGEDAWLRYCVAVARSYKEEYPERAERIYQITWEPVAPWGFKGTAAQLVKIYKIAHDAIHKTDRNAVIIGPAGAPLSQSSIEWNRGLFNEGLARYIDGFSIHPYVRFPARFPPERNDFLENVRALRTMLNEFVSDDFPIFGTEQGYEAAADVEDEILQAQGIVRANLILLGEGWKMNMAFYNHDFEGPAVGKHLKYGGYGFYYALDPKVKYGDKKIAPKPVAPAYAAMTYLLEGHRSLGQIKDLDGTAMGYAYEGDKDIVLALWDYGDSPRLALIPVGAKEIDIYDMMGNGKRISTPAQTVELILGQDPTYIRPVRQ